MVENNSLICDKVFFDQALEIRFWLVAVFGSAVAVLSLVSNISFVASFFHRTRSSWLYLVILGFCDLIYDLGFLINKPVTISYNRWQDLLLKNVVLSYIIADWTLLQTIYVTSVLLILCTVFEQFCIAKSCRLAHYIKNNRKSIVFICFGVAMASHGSMLWEFQVVRNSKCIGAFNEYNVLGTAFMMTYGHIFEYLRPFMQFGPPFLALVILIGLFLTKHGAKVYGPVRQSDVDAEVKHKVGLKLSKRKTFISDQFKNPCSRRRGQSCFAYLSSIPYRLACIRSFCRWFRKVHSFLYRSKRSHERDSTSCFGLSTLDLLPVRAKTSTQY
ncbi:hypothetical protein L596_021823 [Steinernema carpocapsae]|uniref:G-protein coupled receptors family 1 profile domain-containing protein n=1 Tax=Steinernema carpocapsae TaxID=34508 RepID=A0A4U5MJZ6_STECR|nr:hypothetical protein L596_021823 [Steinernema carpocapsae]